MTYWYTLIWYTLLSGTMLFLFSWLILFSFKQIKNYQQKSVNDFYIKLTGGKKRWSFSANLIVYYNRTHKTIYACGRSHAYDFYIEKSGEFDIFYDNVSISPPSVHRVFCKSSRLLKTTYEHLLYNIIVIMPTFLLYVCHGEEHYFGAKDIDLGLTLQPLIVPGWP